MTEQIGYHDFTEPCNIKFNTETLKFKDPEARKAYEQKKDGKPIELTAEQKKKKDENKGMHTIPLYTAINSKNQKVVGPPKIKIKHPLRIKLVQIKENKTKITLSLSKNNIEHMEIINMFKSFENVFMEACINTNAKYIGQSQTYSKKKPLTQIAFETMVKSFLRENEKTDEVTFTISVPIYDNNNTIGTNFYNKNTNDTSKIEINEYNTIQNILTANTQIKFTFTIKEIWISGQTAGYMLHANTIVVVKSAPKIVIRPTNLEKVSKKLFMEFYARKVPADLDGSISIGGNLYHRYNQPRMIDGKLTTNDADNNSMNTLYWHTYPFMQKWSCKSKPFNESQTSVPLQLSMEITPSNNADCINPDILSKGLSSIDEAYLNYMIDNHSTLFDDINENDVLNIDWLRETQKRIVSLSKVTDAKTKQRQTVYLKLQKPGGKIKTLVYDLTEDLERLAANADPETKQKIQDLDPSYLDQFVPYEITKITNDPIYVTDDNIDEVIPPGTWVIAVNKTERWGSYMPPKHRTKGPSGHGLSTSIEIIFILRHDNMSYGGKTTGFENDDNLDDDGVDASKSFTFPSAKTSNTSFATKAAKVAQEESPQRRQSSKSNTSESNNDDDVPKPQKKQNAKKNDDDDDDEDDVPEPPKKQKAKKNDEDAVPEPPKKQKAKKNDGDDDDEDEDDVLEPPKKQKAKKNDDDAVPESQKKQKAKKNDDDDEDEDAVPEPPKKQKAKKNDEDAVPEPQKKQKAKKNDEDTVPEPQKKQKTKKLEENDDEDDEPKPSKKTKEKKSAKAPEVTDD
jgi:hypothetical protein